MDECGFKTPAGPCRLWLGHDGPHLSPWVNLSAEAFRMVKAATAPVKTVEPGWWSIPGDLLLGMLRRVSKGEDPDVVYAEEYANAAHENA